MVDLTHSNIFLTLEDSTMFDFIMFVTTSMITIAGIIYIIVLAQK